MKTIESFSNFIWGYPIILLLFLTSLYLTIKLKFFQFRYFPRIIKETFLSVNKEPHGEGDITPRQALTSALSATVGAANIVGVPAAIMFGGPGAVLWMMIIAILGMALKFSENVLGIYYRERNSIGEFVGGPTYYMKKGFKNKKIGAAFAAVFAFSLMFEAVPSMMVQGNSVALNLKDTFNISPLLTGIILTVLTALIIFGGVQRLAKVTELLVPFMVFLYVTLGFLIVIINIQHLPAVIGLILKDAFDFKAMATGTGIAAFVETIRYGFARGV